MIMIGERCLILASTSVKVLERFRFILQLFPLSTSETGTIARHTSYPDTMHNPTCSEPGKTSREHEAVLIQALAGLESATSPWLPERKAIIAVTL